MGGFERLADEGGFGFDGAGGGGGDSAVREAGFGDVSLAVGGDAEGGRDGGDVHLAPLGDFEKFATTGQRAGQEDRDHQLAGKHDGLAVAGEKVGQWDDALVGEGFQDDGSVEG